MEQDNQEFDARAYIRQHLKKGRHTGTRSAFTAEEGGEDSVSELILRKTGKLQRALDGEVQRIVVSHQDDLLAEANKAAKLQNTVEEVHDDSHELQQDIQRVKSQITEPYERLSKKVTSLRRVLQCTAVMRKVMALQQAVKRIMSQMSLSRSKGSSKEDRHCAANPNSQDFQEHINMWQGRDIVRVVPSLREAEDLLNDDSLASIEAVESQRPLVKRVGRLVRTRLSHVAQASVLSLNQAELGAAMQAAYDLGDLAEVAEYILENCCDAIFVSSLAIFHTSAISRKDGESFSLEDAANEIGATQTEPSDQQRDLWYERIWKQAERFSQKLFKVCVQVWSLQRVLGRKRDPYSQQSLLHHLLSDLQKGSLEEKQLRILRPLLGTNLASQPIQNALKLSIFECFWHNVLTSVKDVFDTAAGESLQDTNKLSIHLREYQEHFKSKFVHRVIVRETPKLRWHLRSSMERVHSSTARVSLKSALKPPRSSNREDLFAYLAAEWTSEGVGGYKHQQELLSSVELFTEKFISSLSKNLKAAVQYTFQDVRFPTKYNSNNISQAPQCLGLESLGKWHKLEAPQQKLVETSKQWEIDTVSWLQQRNCDLSTDPLWEALRVSVESDSLEDPGIISHESISKFCQKMSEYLLLCQNDQSLLSISADSVVSAVHVFVHNVDELTGDHRYAISSANLWNPGMSRQYCGDWLERLQYFLSTLEQSIQTVTRRLDALKDSTKEEETFDLSQHILAPCENLVSRLIRMILYPQAIGISNLLIQRLRPLFAKQRQQSHSSEYLDQLEVDAKLLSDRNLTSLPSEASIREDVSHGIAKRVLNVFLQCISLLSPSSQDTRNQCVADIAQFEKAIAPLCTEHNVEHLGQSYRMLRSFKHFLSKSVDELDVYDDALKELPASLILQGMLSRAPVELNLPHEFDGVSPIVYVYWMDHVAASLWGYSIYGDRLGEIGDEDLLLLQAHVQLFSREEVESKVDRLIWTRVRHCLDSYFQYISAHSGKGRKKCPESEWLENNGVALLNRSSP